MCMLQHHIETRESRPVRLPSYRLPHAYRDTVEKELKEVEACGFIEPSFSEWASLVEEGWHTSIVCGLPPTECCIRDRGISNASNR